MGGGKETPRQKLIGLMYLVLMALLAMNVSKSILNAFITVNEKFERAAELTHGTTDGYMVKIDGQIATLMGTKAPKEEVEKIEEIRDKASAIRELARKAANFFVEQSSDMIGASDPAMPSPFYTKEGDEGKEYYTLMGMDTLSKKDDYDTAPHLFLKEGTHEPSEAGLAIENKLFAFRDSLIVMAANYTDESGKSFSIDPTKIVRPEDSHHMDEYNASLDEALETVKPDDKDKIRRIIDMLTVPATVGNHGEMYPWIAYQFDHAVIVAAATVFTSLKNDVKMAESVAVEIVSSRAKVETFKFNKIDPLAFSSTSYINQGDSLDLKVMIAAYDTTEKMKLRYWIDDTTMAAEGMQEFQGKPGRPLTLSGGVGGHTVVGNIAVKEKGIEKWKPWKFNYSVGAPNAAVAAADLAVLYKGWPNKIKVSASGYDPSTVTVSCKGCSGSLKKEGDYYIARAGGGKKATITVSAKTDDGKSVNLAAEEFRIFPLPKPAIFFGGKSGGSIAKAAASSIPKLIAKLENSPLNVKYEVTKFSFFTTKNGQPITIPVKGNRISGDVKAAIKKMPKRATLTFADIYVKGPSGKEQRIDGGLVIKLK